ncbi:hypothetical protein [Dyadobacter sp. NIV53]|uniref:hypothetical protein n=1 Tax=Dyadobacter sp. NIV53 TaxID=2861765 RepID=UPI001E34EF02|nr:hypothetical protein [Dyadobacter sp. NIV53]
MKNSTYYRFFKLPAFLLFVIVQTVFGQQTNVDSAFVAPTDSLALQSPDSISKPTFVLVDTVRYRFIGDGNFTRGNVNRSLIVLRAEALFSGPLISIATNPRFTYGKQNSVLAERDSYVDLFIDVFKKRKPMFLGWEFWKPVIYVELLFVRWLVQALDSDY